MYANGLGVERDPETAYAWISAASMAGDRRGDYLIPALKQLLTAQETSAADQRSRIAPFKPDQQLPMNSFVP
jgi:TPR repeat protein